MSRQPCFRGARPLNCRVPRETDSTSLLDFYDIEELLTDEERQARDSARQFVQEEVLSEIVPCHRAAKFPDHLIPRMGALGFYAPYLKEHGCAGLSYTAYGLIMQELERADSGLRSLASVQGALAIQAIHSFGSPEQQARWLPGLFSGKLVGCFALTEHGHGSDPGGMETRAKREGDHYILNGSKCWIGNASIADVKVVWAKDDDGRVGGFVVEKDAPDFARTTSKESLVCACRVPRNAGSRTAGSLRRTVCPRRPALARRCHVFRTRAQASRGG